MWSRWSDRRHLAPAWSWRLPRAVYKYLLEKPKRKQIRFQPAARCCLPPLLSTRRRDCCPPGSVPKGVVLEGRCRGGRLTVRGLETSFLERRKASSYFHPSGRETAAAFSTWVSGQLPPRPRASRQWEPDADATEGWRRERARD